MLLGFLAPKPPDPDIEDWAKKRQPNRGPSPIKDAL